MRKLFEQQCCNSLCGNKVWKQQRQPWQQWCSGCRGGANLISVAPLDIIKFFNQTPRRLGNSTKPKDQPSVRCLGRWAGGQVGGWLFGWRCLRQRIAFCPATEEIWPCEAGAACWNNDCRHLQTGLIKLTRVGAGPPQGAPRTSRSTAPVEPARAGAQTTRCRWLHCVRRARKGMQTLL